jgi:hypothetical protein
MEKPLKEFTSAMGATTHMQSNSFTLRLSLPNLKFTRKHADVLDG